MLAVKILSPLEDRDCLSFWNLVSGSL